MKTILNIIIILCLSNSAIGQVHFNATGGALSNGMAGNGVTLTGVDAIFNNQAGIADIEKFSFIASTELRNSIPDLVGFGVGISLPVDGFGVFALSASNLGLADYKEQKIGLAYARSLFNNFDLGLQLDLLNTSIVNFGSRTTGTFELGFMADFGTKFTIGAHIFSPVTVSILNEDNDVNSRLRIGGSYTPSNKVRVLLELEKWFQNDLTVKGGFEYQLVENIAVRIGMSTNPVFYSVGLSYNIFGDLLIDGAYSTHATLGGTPSFSIKNDR